MPKNAATQQDYAALRAFMHGYLHADYKDEYGSAEGAVKEFRNDADDDEFQQVAAQWKTFFQNAKAKPITAIRQAIKDHFGPGWTPKTHDDLQIVTDAFQHPWSVRDED